MIAYVDLGNVKKKKHKYRRQTSWLGLIIWLLPPQNAHKCLQICCRFIWHQQREMSSTCGEELEKIGSSWRRFLEEVEELELGEKTVHNSYTTNTHLNQRWPALHKSKGNVKQGGGEKRKCAFLSHLTLPLSQKRKTEVDRSFTTSEAKINGLSLRAAINKHMTTCLTSFSREMCHMIY